jgi:hypothetical protein
MSEAEPNPAVGRRIAATVLVVVASIVAFLALFSIWLNRQALNTDNWTRTSTELLAKPVIRDQLAAKLTDELYQSVDVQAELAQVLPPRAQLLAGPAANALRNQVEKVIVKALARPDVQALWADANRAAHRQLLVVLDGGGRTISTGNGRVAIDLKALLDEMQQRFGVGGRIAHALPAGSAQITVLRSDQLSTAQKIAKWLRPLPVALLVLSLALVAIAMWIAPGWRRRALRTYGYGFIAAGALALVVRTLGGNEFVNSLARTEAGESAVREIWSVGTSLLVQIAQATIAYGVVMVFAAWLAGPTRWARAVRATIAPYVREPLFAFSGLSVLILVLVWWAPTPAWRNGAMLLILVLLLVAGTEALRRQLIREFPEATREGAGERRRERFAAIASGGRQRAGALRDTVTARTASMRSAEAQPSEEDNRIAQLERLGRLKQAGVLEPAEFEAEKARIINGSGTPA